MRITPSRPSPSTFVGYNLARRVIARAALPFCGARHRLPFGGPLGAEVDVEDDGIARAILTLDQPKRDIILLSYFLGRSDSAIGALTGMPRSTVQHHRASALRLLRDVLAGEVESE